MVNTGKNVIAIVVAAGSGSRYGGDVPKQFLDLDGSPVLARSAFIFPEVFPGCKLYLVLSADGRCRWAEYCDSRSDIPAHEIVDGGATRSGSVLNALRCASALPGFADSIVMIHDGARPLLDAALLTALYKKALAGNAAIPALEVTDSLIGIDGGEIECLSRDGFRTVQTPQVFPGPAILEAFARFESSADAAPVTDDLSVLRRYNPAVPVALVPGDRRNIKITRRGDLALAHFYLDNPDF